MTWYKQTWYHDPVMLQEVLESIPDDCKTFMDGTLGHGGHSKVILEKFDWSNDFVIVGVDRDLNMMSKAKERLAWFKNMKYVHSSYANLKAIAQESKIQKFDYMLLDIGVNMDHFKVADRGFSIKLNGPLDMRFDQTQGISAAQRLKHASYQDILDVLTHETDFSESLRLRLAKELSIAKRKQEFTTTLQLRERASTTWVSDKMLAVLFQAFRILVNNELKELDTFLESFVTYLAPWGICGIMSYHSGEDRRVKFAFKELVDQWVWSLVNKKVITPHWKESKKNKAARSAKWRMFKKINS